MDILIVSQYFWPETFRITDLAEGLAARGHNVTVLTGKPNYPQGSFYPGYSFLNKNKESYGSISIIRSPVIPRGKSRFQLLLNYLSFAFFASIVGVMRCKRPDVILVFEISPVTVALPAIFLKKLKKSPILFWVQDLWPEVVIAVGAIRSKRILTWLEKLVYFIYQRCDYILTTSKSFFDSIKKYNISEDRLKYFPQTCEALYQPIINPTSLLEEKLLPAGFRIIFSGNIGIAQGIETILEAAKLLREHLEIKWIFLGDGSKRSWLQQEIKRNELSDSVYWLGQYPVETMPRFFACADAMLVVLKKNPVSSLTIPGKIQSYLACGKPIIAALDGEARQLIEEAEAGLTTHSGDPQSLAHIVMDMYKLSASSRMQMGINGRKYFDKFFQRDVLLKNLEGWMAELREKNK